MSSELKKIECLERIYKNGYEDDFIDKALDKIISFELYRDRKTLQSLHNDLQKFEKKYGISSKRFSSKFRNGKTEDTADFMEWHSLYEMFSKLTHRLQILQGK